jgi:hypothetical protein
MPNNECSMMKRSNALAMWVPQPGVRSDHQEDTDPFILHRKRLEGRRGITF